MKTRVLLIVLAVLAAAPVRADYDAGVEAAIIGDYATAFSAFARSAAQGDMRAANALGELYERGDGVERDPARAAEWYRRAAEAGNRDAQYNLAGMYRSGDGVPLDHERSMDWYQRAAEQGLAIAQFFVAKNHEHGQGVPQDLAEAWAWYALAAEAGDSGSARNRDRVAGFLDETQQRRAQAQLRRHAAQLGLTPARRAALGIPDKPADAAADRVKTGAEPAAPPRELVVAVQQALVELGYDAGDADGIAGSRTRAAVADFAASVGMQRSPDIGVELLTRLQATLAARQEASRALVTEPAVDATPAAGGAAVDPTGATGPSAIATAPSATGDSPAEPPAAAPTEPAGDAGASTKPNGSGELAERTAELLASLGYAPSATGSLDAALQALAGDAGLERAPAATPRLLERLESLRPLVQAAPTGRELVRALQSALAELGQEPGAIDGLMGRNTRTAIRRWAAAHGLPRTPAPSPLLLALLREGPLLPVEAAPAARAPGTPTSSPSPASPAASATDLALLDALGAAGGARPVRLVQQALARLGHDPGPADGLVGARTRGAVRDFREARGLPGGDSVDGDLPGQLSQALRALAGPRAGASTQPAAAERAPTAIAGEEDRVRAAQRLLGELGFDAGPVDGIAGTRTLAAVRAFEGARGDGPAGAATPITPALVQRLRDALAAKRPLAAEAATVREVQRRLTARGFRPGPADGALGAATRAALRAFQRAHDLGSGSPLARLRRAPDPPRLDAPLLRDVQTALAERGFDPGPVDGALGPATRAAVALFREAEGLPPGEIVDTGLLRRLDLLAR